MNLIASTVANNGAALAGGGIFLGAGSLTVENSTISGNNAGTTGGGIHNQPSFFESNPQPSFLELTNATIAGNAADVGGGLITEPPSTSATKNTIVALNANGGDCSGPITSLGHNLDSDGSCGLSAPGDLPRVSALLAPLADNGGLTLTHAPEAGSAAIDTGGTNSPPTDQRGAAAWMATEMEYQSVTSARLSTLFLRRPVPEFRLRWIRSRRQNPTRFA